MRRSVQEKLTDDIQLSMIDRQCLIPLNDVTMHLPMAIGGFLDLYCSLEHCQNVSACIVDLLVPYHNNKTSGLQSVLLCPSTRSQRIGSTLHPFIMLASSVVPSLTPIR